MFEIFGYGLMRMAGFGWLWGRSAYLREFGLDNRRVDADCELCLVVGIAIMGIGPMALIVLAMVAHLVAGIFS